MRYQNQLQYQTNNWNCFIKIIYKMEHFVDNNIVVIIIIVVVMYYKIQYNIFKTNLYSILTII